MLPKNLKYGSKVESAMARSSRVNVAPQNGTSGYNLGDTIIINIPTRNNLVLVPTESYLKFNLRVTAGTAGQAIRWDSCGAHGLISRIRVFHASSLLSDVDQYGLLAKILFDLQQPTDSTQGKQSLLSGTRSDTVLMTPTVAAVGNNQVADINTLVTGFSAKPIPTFNANSGERLGGAGTAVTAAADLIPAAGSPAETYCLNLISLVGSLCSSNYFPLFACTSAPLRVEITLVDNMNKAAGCMSGPSGAIIMSNVEYVGNFIELGDSAMQTIYGSLGNEPLQFCVPDFRNYAFNAQLAQNTATQIAMPIPAKFSSLKAIVVAARDKGLGANQFFPFSCGTQGITSYNFRVGAQVFPPKEPNTLCEMYAEVLKAFGSIADLNYQPSIDRRSYTGLLNNATANINTLSNVSLQYTGDAEGVVSGISSGSFYVGIDLESYAAASKDTIFAGYNSNTDDIFFMGNFTTAGATAQVRFDAFANFDSVIVCENGTCYVKY
jgi:hypothetical protein